MLSGLPAVPAASRSCSFTAADRKAEQPQHQQNRSHNPQDVYSRPETGKEQHK